MPCEKKMIKQTERHEPFEGVNCYLNFKMEVISKIEFLAARPLRAIGYVLSGSGITIPQIELPLFTLNDV